MNTETTAPLAIEKKINLLELNAKSCRGKCKVYNLSIAEDGSTHYTGKKNVSNIGAFTGTWDLSVVDSIFTNHGFNDFEESYLSGARDIQKFEIIYKGKTVIFHKRKAPQGLIDILNTLDAKISNTEWESL